MSGHSKSRNDKRRKIKRAKRNLEKMLAHRRKLAAAEASPSQPPSGTTT